MGCVSAIAVGESWWALAPVLGKSARFVNPHRGACVFWEKSVTAQILWMFSVIHFAENYLAWVNLAPFQFFTFLLRFNPAFQTLASGLNDVLETYLPINSNDSY